MKKLRCLLVDDEPPALDVLRSYVENTPMLELVGECHHAVSAFEFLQDKKVDLLFLDVNLPKLSGTDFVKALNNPPKIIFTTAHKDFAVDGFELGAVDYLLKPFSLERFWKAVQRATSSDENSTTNTHTIANDRFLYFRADRKMVKVMVDEILYVESLKDYVKIFLSGRQIITKQTISSVEEMLPEENFVRIHRSFIASKNKIESYSQNSVFIGKNELPVGPLYRQTFLQQIGS
jgi:DNA-binding LytR/AlgR family response regulator